MVVFGLRKAGSEGGREHLMARGNGTANCVIGAGSVFEGRFHVNGSILIEGKFQGEIRTSEQLTVGASGRVKTDIAARQVTVAGTLIGNITATEEVSLLQSGKVLGNITTPRLRVEAGVITEGKLTITSGEDGRVRELVEAAFGESPESVFGAAKKEARARGNGQE
jgi:cytoskeletal protein CcmA (bactofilin family)